MEIKEFFGERKNELFDIVFNYSVTMSFNEEEAKEAFWKEIGDLVDSIGDDRKASNNIYNTMLMEYECSELAHDQVGLDFLDSVIANLFDEDDYKALCDRIAEDLQDMN